ncbi:MAG: HD domain-containing protein [Clostridium sp.]
MYRIKQFIWAILTSFKRIDYEFIQKYLDDDEIKLFEKLKLSEQHHSIRVCRESIRISNGYKYNQINQIRLCKMALLHDIGKIEQPLTVIDKSIIVILDKLSKGNLKAYCSVKKVDSYYNHAKKSAIFLGNLKKYDTEFLDTIMRHHERIMLEDNLYLKIIKESDDLN